MLTSQLAGVLHRFRIVRLYYRRCGSLSCGSFCNKKITLHYIAVKCTMRNKWRYAIVGTTRNK